MGGSGWRGWCLGDDERDQRTDIGVPFWVAVTLIVPALANEMVSAVVPVVRAKLAMLLGGEWNNRKYDVAAFNALVALVPPAARYGGTIGITSWVVLLTWLSAAIAVTVAGLLRPFLSPSPFARFSLDARLSQTTTIS